MIFVKPSEFKDSGLVVNEGQGEPSRIPPPDRLESSSSSEASTAGPRKPRFAELPKLRSGSFGVLTVSFFASVITVEEVDDFSLGTVTREKSTMGYRVTFSGKIPGADDRFFFFF